MPKPQDTGVMKPLPKNPRERLSLPLSPNLTAAVQALGKAFHRQQAAVLADLLALSVPALTRNLDALRVKYEGEQRKALEGVLGRPADATEAAEVQEGSVRGAYGNDPGD